jgi:Tfp pilus assembly PilM family ATPase
LKRFLALDWDHKQLHIVVAAVSGGVVRVQKTAVFAEEQTPNLGEAEALGQRLRAHLKEAGIAPAPVLACVGRDRVILKEVRYPAVKPSEEPALVRFQAAKELTEPMDEVVLDYATTGQAAAGGEQRALALIVRRELLNAYQALCQAAGLKLSALVPRPFALLACLNAIGIPPSAADAGGPGLAVLSLTERWAELCVARGDTLLFARSLASGASLAGEVRRNLAVYGGQWPQHPVRTLYVADGGVEHAALCGRLRELMQIPVEPFDPFAGTQGTPPSGTVGGSFAAAVGLLRVQAQRRPFAVNFVHPKEPLPPDTSSRKRLLVAAGLAASLLLVLVWFGHSQLASLDTEMASLLDRKASLDRELHLLQEDEARIQAINEWTDGEVVWLDELYDLAERFPDVQRMHLTTLNGEPLTRTTKGKNATKYVARLTLKGIINYDYELVDQLIGRLTRDGHYRPDPKQIKPNTGIDRIRFRQEFSTRADVEKRLPKQYTSRLAGDDGEGRTRNRGRRQRGQEGDFGFDSFGGDQP